MVNLCFKVCDDSQSAVRISSIFQYNCIDRYASKKYDPLGLFAPVLGLAFRRISLCRYSWYSYRCRAMEAEEEAGKAQAEADDTSKCNKTKCPPCKTISGKIVPVGTIGYRLDLVPPSKPHYPFEGSHYHFYKANQNTDSCRCFWSKAGIADASNGLPSSDYIMVEDFMQ